MYEDDADDNPGVIAPPPLIALATLLLGLAPDRGRDLSKMNRLDLAQLAHGNAEVLDKVELGHEIIANGMWRRRACGEPHQLLAPAPAFRLESVLQRITGDGLLAMIVGHVFFPGLSGTCRLVLDLRSRGSTPPAGR